MLLLLVIQYLSRENIEKPHLLENNFDINGKNV